MPHPSSSPSLGAAVRRLIVLALLCFAAVPQTEAADTPVSVIENLHRVLLDIMKRADELGVEGRYRHLQPVLDQTYDFERMIAIAAGSHWTDASDEIRKSLAAAFRRFSTATYASRFNGYAGERFELLGERPGPRDAILVDTRIVRSDGDPVPITYVFRSANDRWRISDVLLEQAISEIAVRRSEYAKVLAEGGPARLTEILNQRADALLRG